MKNHLLNLLTTYLTTLATAWAAPTRTSDNIHIDQFGYRPTATKVAVIGSPVQGFNASETFAPSVGANQYELRRWKDDAVVLRGTLTPWNGGATDATSGDKAWWFDFSSIQEVGSYYVFDVGNNVGSGRFEIHPDVYNNLLRTATRVFFYNRCNAEKKAQHAGTNWADGPSFVKAGQDTECRSVRDRTNAATARDLSGGWWDAGDYNKYVTFANKPVHQLLDAYTQQPAIWTDDLNLPESNNNVPDLLDELKWELDWLLKMQNPDGSAILKMGLVANAPGASLPPSTDTRPRFYYPEKSTAAAVAIAGMLAHAALVYDNVPGLKAYAATLRQKAILSFDYYENTPTKTTATDDRTIEAGDADWDEKTQQKARITAAVYLFALTGEAKYKQLVDANFRDIPVMSWWGPYDVPWGDALLYYASLPTATASTAEAIRTRKVTEGRRLDIYRPTATTDPYRAFMPTNQYHWGSNHLRADFANIAGDIAAYKLDEADRTVYLNRAEELLHALHGLNPLNLTYLSNMGVLGAEKSISRIYHSWFADKSAWAEAGKSAKGGPPPGYLAGGPNKDYAPGEGNCILVPPCNQPPQKSYRDWNTVWPDASWKITEPAIYYQAAYIKALARFVTSANAYTLPQEVAQVILNTEETSLFRVYPNPGNGLVTVEFTAEQSSAYTFVVTDATGRMVCQLRYAGQKGQNRVALDINPAGPGTYLIRCETNGQAYTKKVQVL
jgi:endoglucanase